MLVTIGRVAKPWGVRGEVKVEPLTDFPDRFRNLRSVYLTAASGETVEYVVKSVSYRGGIPYLLFEGRDSPEKAQELTGLLVQIREEETIPLPEGSYYWYELLGMEVVSESGDILGTITDIFETGSNDVYVVKQGGKESFIPATRELIRQVDRKARRMVIRVVEGLLE